MATVGEGRQRTVLSLTDEAVAALIENSTDRKRGEIASKALLSYFGGKPQQEGILERIESRLERIEKQLAALQKAS